MAGINEIYDPRINLALSRRLGMSSGPATTLAPEIMTTLDLGPMPELEFNLGWERWQMGVFRQGVAGEFGQIQFRMNDTLDQVAIIDQISVGTAAAGGAQLVADFGYGPGTADLASQLTLAEFRDGRQRPKGNQLAVISHGTTAGGLVPTQQQALQMFVPAFFNIDIPGAPWVLFKGNALLFQVASANTNLLMTFVWRMRPVASGEQQPLVAQGG